MGETFNTNSYWLCFKKKGNDMAIAIKEIGAPEENKYTIVAKSPNREDLTQIWVYNAESQRFVSLFYPFVSFIEEKVDDQHSKLAIADIDYGKNINQTFSFYSGFITNKNLEKFIIPTEDPDDPFILSSNIPDDITMEIHTIDISNYCIPYPIPDIPCAILFSIAAEEYALTLGPVLSAYDNARKLTFTPFKPEQDPNQFWYYFPNHNYSFYSCAESDTVIKTVNDNGSIDIIMSSSNTKKKNQNWKIYKRSIYSSKYDAFLSINEKRKNFALCDDENKIEENQFYYYPLFEHKTGILARNEVISPNDDMRDASLYSSDFDEYDEESRYYASDSDPLLDNFNMIDELDLYQ